MGALQQEVDAALQDLRPGVHVSAIQPEEIPMEEQDPEEPAKHLQITTLEGMRIVVRITAHGFQVIKRHGDPVELPIRSTIQAVMNANSPGYINAFAGELATRLTQLPDRPLDDESG
eukprot:CAMPEP_0175917638 /NCGR_PEP_ID=MMETSP0108-20121206/11465_1 /TAXON_ID=195067 ORGANISM="Goniomonas pacifica, Strain CCMP1869" /NCGR_SAMPLE_ID=MMETSP0108 /ASSEMBLY_ACC=CAM_ASM_000204 /LENGTH=116 /DNA_ID=CAMNT_0017240227 /DNA_START=32 /DNA_END=382 /DNA_ORIENTATION=-